MSQTTEGNHIVETRLPNHTCIVIVPGAAFITYIFQSKVGFLTVGRSMSVSSHTLSFERESIDGDEGTPMDLDSEVEEDYSDVCSSCEGVRNSSRGKSISKDEDNMHIPIIYRRPGLPYGYTPSMLAAAHPDPRILKQVLQSGYKSYLADIDPDTLRRILAPTLGPNACCEVPGRYNDLLEDKRKCLEAQFGPDVTRMVYSKGGEGEGYTSPLMEAIHHSFPSNVRTLLEAGADPNGIPKSILSSYAALFLRFRPAIPDRDFVENGEDVATREGLLSLMHVEQTAPLTVEELEDRYWDGMAPFWCEEGHAPLNFYKGGEGMPALVEAARNGSIEIFEQLMEAGADASFWLKKQKNLPNPPTPSSLSVSSPIHAALQSRDVQMLRFLLERGFDPNLMPLATPTRCFTPLMATLIYHENFYEEAFDELAKQKEIDFDVRTPVYGVHVLHFAVATLNLELLRYVVHFIPLEKAGVTALGQNLLHIACLSPNSRAVNRESKAIFESIHETRNLHAQPNDRSGDVLYPDSNEVTAIHRA